MGSGLIKSGPLLMRLINKIWIKKLNGRLISCWKKVVLLRIKSFWVKEFYITCSIECHWWTIGNRSSSKNFLLRSCVISVYIQKFLNETFMKLANLEILESLNLEITFILKPVTVLPTHLTISHRRLEGCYGPWKIVWLIICDTTNLDRLGQTLRFCRSFNEKVPVKGLNEKVSLKKFHWNSVR